MVNDTDCNINIETFASKYTKSFTKEADTLMILEAV